MLVCVLAAPAAARTCQLDLRLDDSVTIAALQLTVDYSSAFGALDAAPNGVACQGDAFNTLALFRDDEDTSTLTASFLSLSGFTGPGRIAHCTFLDLGGNAVAADFAVSIEEATSPDGEALAAPRIFVLLPDCGDTATTTSTSTSTTTTSTTTSTTSTSTTSTTLPECGNGIVDGDEDCDDGEGNGPDGNCDAECHADVVCGDANGNDAVQSGDALLVLRAAIGQQVPCPEERCDVDGDRALRANDALRVLKRAVGQSVAMACPPPA